MVTQKAISLDEMKKRWEELGLNLTPMCPMDDDTDCHHCSHWIIVDDDPTWDYCELLP